LTVLLARTGRQGLSGGSPGPPVIGDPETPIAPRLGARSYSGDPADAGGGARRASADCGPATGVGRRPTTRSP